MRLNHKHLILAVLVGLIASCDYIEEPFLQDTNTGGEIVENPTKVVIMDFTGHTCKSCPKAHRTIHMIEQVYEEQAIPIAFHLGYFATPKTDGKYEADFRTPEGTELEGYYPFVSFPIGWVNKMGKDDLIPYPSLAAETDDYSKIQSPLIVNLTPAYLEDQATARVTIEIKDNGYSGLSGLKMATYLLEDHIISYQRDEEAVPMDVADYEHNHVFRIAYQNVWAEEIDLSGFSHHGLEFVRDIPMEANWQAANCRLVVFVYHPATMTIIQAEAVALIEE